MSGRRSGCCWAPAGATPPQSSFQLEEEEQMDAPYGSDDLSRDWEFKIVRAKHGRSSETQSTSTGCSKREAAGAGLVLLLEKFDNSRIRFKAAARGPTSMTHTAAGPGSTRTGFSTVFVAGAHSLHW